MVDTLYDANQVEKSIAQKAVEGWGLDYPDDVEKLVEVLEETTGEGGTLGGIFQALIEAFPDKKDRILSIPMFTEIDGQVYRVTLPMEDYDQVR
jgi:hypothetical protein